MKSLKSVDQVAYVRFASVYRDFQDIEEFAQEISTLSKEKSDLKPLKNEFERLHFSNISFSKKG